MVFWPPYPWYIDPYSWYSDPPTHGILTLLPMEYRPPTHGILTPYPWYFDPPIHGISTPLPMIYWPPYPRYFDSPPTHDILTSLPISWLEIGAGVKIPWGFNIPWMKIDPGVNLPWGSIPYDTGYSTNKTDCHDITEILLKVAFNTINQT